MNIKVVEYEELLMEESHRKRTSMGTYYQVVNNHELAIADLVTISTCVCPVLGVLTKPNQWRKTQSAPNVPL